jgi:hypothetical protein
MRMSGRTLISLYCKQRKHFASVLSLWASPTKMLRAFILSSIRGTSGHLSILHTNSRSGKLMCSTTFRRLLHSRVTVNRALTESLDLSFLFQTCIRFYNSSHEGTIQRCNVSNYWATCLYICSSLSFSSFPFFQLHITIFNTYFGNGRI